MIGLMWDAKLRLSEAAALTWGDVRRLRDGSGRVRVGGSKWMTGGTIFEMWLGDCEALPRPTTRRL